MNLRSSLYPWARFLGEYQAINNGGVGRRAEVTILRRFAPEWHDGDGARREPQRGC
jgi:hypothetical protein